MIKVSILKCKDYSPERVRAAVSAALDLAELDTQLIVDGRVLLKPNLLSTRAPEQAVTTHPAIVRELGILCLRQGCSVVLGDSPPFAGESVQRYQRLIETTGMAEVAGQLGVEVARFESEPTELPFPDGKFYRSFSVGRPVIDSDIVINIPKLKTHGLTAFSGAVKNVFGCVPGIRKGLFHVQAAEDPEVFAQMLVDLYAAVRPTVHVMDAVVAMEGEGPNAGDPKNVGLIVASSDGVALDAVACSVVGIDPMSVHTTRLAHEQGIGCADLEQIDIVGETIENVRVLDFRQSSGQNDWARIPYPIRRLLRRQLVAVPKATSGECVGCGDCVKACPVGAIESGRPVRIDLDKCIRCYCCHEVCNFSAMELKRGLLGRLLLRG